MDQKLTIRGKHLPAELLMDKPLRKSNPESNLHSSLNMRTDGNGTILFASKSLLDLLGKDTAELKGESVHSFFQITDSNKLTDILCSQEPVHLHLKGNGKTRLSFYIDAQRNGSPATSLYNWVAHHPSFNESFKPEKLFGAHPQAVLISNHSNRIIYSNAAAVALLKIREEKLLHRSLKEIFKGFVSEEGNIQQEIRYKPAGGEEFINLQLNGSITEIADEELQLITIVEVGEQTLESQLDRIISSADEIVFEFDAEMRYKKFWCKDESLLELIPIGFLGKTIEEAFSNQQEFIQPIIKDFRQSLLTNSISIRDFSMLIGKEQKWFTSKVSPLFHSDHSPRGFIQRITEITERKLVDLAIDQRNEQVKVTQVGLNHSVELLKAVEERYTAFIQQSSEGIWRFETPEPISIHLPAEEILEHYFKTGFLAECNDAFAQMYGFEYAKDLAGIRLKNLMPVEDTKNKIFFESFIQSGFRLLNAESREKDKSGVEKFFLNNLIGIIENGNLMRIWGTQRDITVEKESEKNIWRLVNLVYNATDIIISQDNDFCVCTWNKAAEEIYGIKAIQAIGKPFAESVILAYNDDISPDQIIKEVNGKGIWKGEASFKNKAGLTTHILITWNRLKDEESNPIGYFCIGKDITAIREAQQELIRSEHFFKSLIGDSLDGTVVADKKGFITYATPAVSHVLGYEKYEVVGKHCLDFVHSEDIEIAKSKFMSLVESSGEQEYVEVRVRKKSGEFLWMMVRGHNSLKNPWIKSIIIYFTDISKAKHAETVLKESEHRFRQFADSAPVKIWVTDEFDRITYVNQRWLSFTGISFEEATNNVWAQLVHADDLAKAVHQYNEAFATRKPIIQEYRFRNHSGDFRWVLDQSTPRFLEDGSFLGYIGTVIDIHDRKLAEEKISYQAQVMRDISEAIISTDLQFNIVSWNKAAENIYGISKESVIGKSTNTVLNHHYIGITKDEVLKEIFVKGSWTGDTYVDRNDGKRIYLNTSLSIVKNEIGEAVGLAGIHRDITDRRKSEDALRISEERYRSVVNALGEGIIVQARNGDVIASNTSAEKMLGVSKEELLNYPDSIQQWNGIHDDGTPFPLEQQPAVITLQTGQSFENVVLGLHKRDGSLLWLSVNTEPIFYSEQKIVPDAVVSSFIDITEKKTADLELIRNEQQLREYSDRITSILDSITDGFIALDKDFNIILWNQVFENYTGIRALDAIGRNMIEVFPELLAADIYEEFIAAMQKNETLVKEHYFEKQNIWFETSAYPSMQGLFIYLRNITQRKKQETLLNLEKQVLEINARPSVMLHVTVNYFLEGIEKLFPGMRCSVVTLEEDRKTIRHLSGPSLPPEFVKCVDGLQIGPAAGSCGTAMYRREKVIVSDVLNDPLWQGAEEVARQLNFRACWSLPILSASNEVLATIAAYYPYKKEPSTFEMEVLDRVVNLLRIIIENKKSEAMIKLSNERYLLATKATNDAIWDWDMVNKTMYFGEGFYTLFGHRPGYNNVDSEWESRIHPADRPRVLGDLYKFIGSNNVQIWEDEYHFQKADGSYALVHDRGFFIYDQQGKISRMIGSMQDITEKKEMEKTLLRQEIDKQKLVAKAMVETQEKERAEIGKELHDNVNQILSTARLYLELAKNDESERIGLIDRSSSNILDAINEIRTISRSLVPSSIDDLGLVESLHDLAESIRATKKLSIEFYHQGPIDQVLSEQQKITLFRIAQEQANNVLKHAEARNLIIELVMEENAVDLSISDDGKGFELDNVKGKKGLGLSNISSRAELFNGEVNIVTAPGKGCKMKIHIPIQFNKI